MIDTVGHLKRLIASQLSHLIEMDAKSLGFGWASGFPGLKMAGVVHRENT